MKLKAKRIDLFIYEINATDNLLPGYQLDSTDFEPVFLITKKDIYFAFNPDTDTELIEKFQRAFDEVVASSASEP